jgi:hypothetical protein
MIQLYLLSENYFVKLSCFCQPFPTSVTARNTVSKKSEYQSEVNASHHTRIETYFVSAHLPASSSLATKITY